MHVRVDGAAIRSFTVTEGPDPTLVVRAGLLPDKSLLELMAALAPLVVALAQQLTG